MISELTLNLSLVMLGRICFSLDRAWDRTMMVLDKVPERRLVTVAAVFVILNMVLLVWDLALIGVLSCLNECWTGLHRCRYRSFCDVGQELPMQGLLFWL